MENPKHEHDEDRDKIGETIGILNVNLDDIRSHKAGKCSLIDWDTTEFIAKDRSYTKARIKYAMDDIAPKLEKCYEQPAEIKEAW